MAAHLLGARCTYSDDDDDDDDDDEFDDDDDDYFWDLGVPFGVRGCETLNPKTSGWLPNPRP